MAKFVLVTSTKGALCYNVDQVVYVRECGDNDCVMVLANGNEIRLKDSAKNIAAILNRESAARYAISVPSQEMRKVSDE